MGGNRGTRDSLSRKIGEGIRGFRVLGDVCWRLTLWPGIGQKRNVRDRAAPQRRGQAWMESRGDMNHILRNRPLPAILLGLALVPARLLAVEGGRDAIVIVADSRRFSGWKAWWTNLYNESHLGFALVTILIIPAVGLIVGMLTGWLLARTGVNLKTRELAER